MIKSLAKRSSLYFLGLLVGKALSFAVFILFARVLLPEVFGDFILFVTIIQLVTFIADFGLIQWYQKQASTQSSPKLFSLVIQARITTFLISIPLTIIFLTVTRTFVPFSVNLLLLSVIFFEAILSVSDGYYLEKNKSFVVALKTLLRMSALLVFYLILKPSTLQMASFYYLISTVITALFYCPWKSIKIEAISIKTSLSTLKNSSAYAIIIFTSFFYSRGDSLLIGYMINSSALGIYSAAYRFLESLNLMGTAVSHNLFPIAAKNNGINLKQTIYITSLFFILGIFLALALFFGAEILILTLLGSAYGSASAVLRIFSIALVFFLINSPLSTVVQSSKLVKLFLPFGVTNTLLNIILNIIFIPFFGIEAAAWCMVFTEISGTIINIYFVKKIYASS